MTITSNFTEPFSLLVNTFKSQLTFENTSAAANTLEAAFYFSLRGGSIQGKRLVKWLRNTSITYLCEIQFLFNAINVGLIACSTQKFLNEMQRSYIFSIIKERYGKKALESAPAATIVAVATVVFLGWKLVNRFSPKLADPESFTKKDIGQTHTLNITETLGDGQTISKILHITKLVLNVALACFAKNPFWFIVSLGTSSYSLWKNIQFKWITFSRDFPTDIKTKDNPATDNPIVGFPKYNTPFPTQPDPVWYPWYNEPKARVTNLKTIYHVLALPVSSKAVDKQCAICLEEDVTPKIPFCINHVVHRSCLVDHVHEKSANFRKIDQIIKTSTRNYRNGAYVGTSRGYTIRTNRKNLLSCVECGDALPQSSLNIEVTDSIHGKFNASVQIDRSQVD